MPTITHFGDVVTNGSMTVNGNVSTTAQFRGPGTGITGTATSLIAGATMRVSGTTAPITGTTVTATTQFTGPGTGLTGTANGLVVQTAKALVDSATPVSGDVITVSTQFTGPGTGLTGIADALNVGVANVLVGVDNLVGTTITASTQFTGPGTGITGTAVDLTAGTALNLTGNPAITVSSIVIEGGRSATLQTITSGSGTWTKPTTGYYFVKFELWGAGGSGIGPTLGGGGGAYFTITQPLSLVPATMNYSVAPDTVSLTRGEQEALGVYLNGYLYPGGQASTIGTYSAAGGFGSTGSGSGAGLYIGQYWTTANASTFAGGRPGSTTTGAYTHAQHPWGGGGRGNTGTNTSFATNFPGNAIFGGAGGHGSGAINSASGYATYGKSVYGGSSVYGGDGLPPGAGGSAKSMGLSTSRPGNGARGEIRITMW
jgi:hypothetical protein